MNAADLEKALVEWTVAHSGHDPARRYLGMSRISECARKLYHEVLDGPPRPHRDDLLLFHAGYLFEADVKHRLEALGLYAPGRERELRALNGRFVGHIDGEVEGDLLEIKSVTLAKLDRIIKEGRIPSSHYCQVQCYLLHGSYARALVVYVARDTGFIHVAPIFLSRQTAGALTDKARRVLEAVDARREPMCECGRCQDGAAPLSASLSSGSNTS